MDLRGPAALLLLAGASCGPAPTRPPPPLLDPASDARRAKDEEIVALLNGRPLAWRSVAERLMETDLKRAVDQYARGRIVEDRREALGLVHAPAELRRRAEALARQARGQLGDAAFRERLSGEGFTEESYVEHLAGSRWLDESLALEKIVRWEGIRRGTLEIDWMIFSDAEDARRFLEACREKGFDAAAGAFQGAGRVTRRPRESFPRGIPPGPPSAPALDPRTAEALGRMKPGEVSGIEPGGPGLRHVIRLAASRPGRDAPYAELKDGVFEGILRDPPAPAECLRWIESEFAAARIEYAQKRPPRAKGR